ncbi:MAG: DUF4249 domain-containing protein, partial [Bacteroidota bacterium]
INLLFISSSFFLFSCEEIIEVNLNESNPQWVIEARIDDQTNEALVDISSTASYFEPGEFEPGRGASVSISSSTGESYELTEYAAGKYRASNVDLQLQEQYDLQVELEGKSYEAISILQAPLQIDSLVTEFRAGGIGPEEGYYVRLAFQDPPGVRNYLRLEIWVNGELRPDIGLYDDNLTDGNEIAFPLFIDPFELGDTVEIKVHAVDFEVYRYWTALSSILGNDPGGGNSAAPANPPTNISNDALGYFGVSSVTEVSKVIR